MKKHIASHALLSGFTNTRTGTRYLYNFEHVERAWVEPHFRFRNAECKAKYFRWKDEQVASAIRNGGKRP